MFRKFINLAWSSLGWRCCPRSAHSPQFIHIHVDPYGWSKRLTQLCFNVDIWAASWSCCWLEKSQSLSENCSHVQWWVDEKGADIGYGRKCVIPHRVYGSTNIPSSLVQHLNLRKHKLVEKKEKRSTKLPFLPAVSTHVHYKHYEILICLRVLQKLTLHRLHRRVSSSRSTVCCVRSKGGNKNLVMCKVQHACIFMGSCPAQVCFRSSHACSVWLHQYMIRNTKFWSCARIQLVDQLDQHRDSNCN